MTLTREESIDRSVQSMMADEATLADIADEIQQRDGMAALAFRSHLMAWWYGETCHIQERAADQLAGLINAFAIRRATDLHDRLPLVPQ